MVKFAKKLQVLALIFLLSAFSVAAISPSLATVKAAGQATVDVIASVGGTTDPAASSTPYTYADGTVVTLTATPGDDFVFQNWEIVTSAGGTADYNNPTNLTVSGGVTYAVEAVFQPLLVTPGGPLPANMATAAIVVVLASVGGTTSPLPGTYALADATSFQLKATPTSGFTFDHWVIGGTPLTHGAYAFTDTPTDNPYTVDHGYGNTYTYLAVFKPTTVPEFSSAALIFVALTLVSIAFGTYAYKRKK